MFGLRTGTSDPSISRMNTYLKILFTVVAVFFMSCSKQVMLDPNGSIRLNAEVRKYVQNTSVGTLYWYSLIYLSRPVDAKTEIMLQWSVLDGSGRIISKESFKATVMNGQPDPAVECTLIKALSNQKAKDIKIVSAVSDDPNLKFEF
jgi:hypothetical protein